VRRQRAPHPLPEWDAEQGLWWMSSAWRLEAARVLV
jgi:hypothetical protein